MATCPHDNTVGQHVPVGIMLFQRDLWRFGGKSVGTWGTQLSCQSRCQSSTSPLTSGEPQVSRNWPQRPAEAEESAACPSRLGLRASGPASPRASSPPQAGPRQSAEWPVQGRRSVQRSRRHSVVGVGEDYSRFTRLSIRNRTSSRASTSAASISWYVPLRDDLATICQPFSAMKVCRAPREVG